MLVKVIDAIDVRYNTAAAWYVFSDSTMTNSKPSEDTIDNNSYTYSFSKGKRYNITGYVHFEYANWLEPRNINDIDSINVYPPNVSLWDLQYNKLDSCGAIPNSAYDNQFITIGGIITGADYKGYWVQTSHATEWAAVFVYDKIYHPVVGDSVILSGKVDNYYGEIELTSITDFTIVSHGNQALTPPTIVAFDSIQKRKYQALLVKVKDAICIRYNSGANANWYVFSDSTITNSKPSEDTIDNDAFHYTFTIWKRYNITGCIQLEYANWIEPRNIYDIDSLNNTGIREQQNDYADVNLYPNPTIENLNIEISRQATIDILNIQGQLMRVIAITDNKTTVDVSSLPRGVYIIEVKTDKGIEVKNFVKE
jgi:hypothetical protein